MSRIQNVFLPPGAAFSAGANIPVVDVSAGGGQMGYTPDYTSWVSNQAMVRRNLICLLVEAPTIFQSLPSPDYWVGTLRALVELCALSITGLNLEITVETSDANPVGGAGQVQEEFTNVTMARSTPTFRWNERYGMAIYRFLAGWIRYGMMDPESKVASVNTIPGNAVPDMLADRYSATMIFIEPDPTMTTVNKSWLCTNMWPKRTGEQAGQRELTTAMEIATLDIEFAALTQFGAGVDALAQRLLNAISITGANPYNAQAFVQAITADVAAQSTGFANGVETLAETATIV